MDNAPITAGNFIDKVHNGQYDGIGLRIRDGANRRPQSDDRDQNLPLEVKPIDDYESYRSPLNVMGAEEPPTPLLSVNGSAMARGIEDGTSSATQFFVYQFDKRSAGLGGLAFEEGVLCVWLRR